jgi:hypothetical protein
VTGHPLVAGLVRRGLRVWHDRAATLRCGLARRPLAVGRAVITVRLPSEPGDAEEYVRVSDDPGGMVIERTERKKVPDSTI